MSILSRVTYQRTKGRSQRTCLTLSRNSPNQTGEYVVTLSSVWINNVAVVGFEKTPTKRLIISTKTQRRAGRPAKRWEDDLNEFVKDEETEATQSDDLKNNNTCLIAAENVYGWEKKGRQYARNVIDGRRTQPNLHQQHDITSNDITTITAATRRRPSALRRCARRVATTSSHVSEAGGHHTYPVPCQFLDRAVDVPVWQRQRRPSTLRMTYHAQCTEVYEHERRVACAYQYTFPSDSSPACKD